MEAEPPQPPVVAMTPADDAPTIVMRERPDPEWTPEPAAPVADIAAPPAKPADAGIATLDWDALEDAVGSCTACPLHASRTRPVFGVGNRTADWLIVGEAPGAEEDRRGEPFVGRAGKLLDAMLMALGLDRQTVYIANILKSRPPGNRDPEPAETDACWPFLARQITLLQPKLVLAVGRIAAQRLLSSDEPVGRLRGRVHRLPGFDLPLVVTYHPAYLLRSPSEKSRAWDDLRLAWRTYRAQEDDA